MIKICAYNYNRKIIVTDEYRPEFDDIKQIAAADKQHRLSRNYANLDIKKFDLIFLLIDQGKPVGFHGIMTKPFYADCKRLFSRYYIKQDARSFLLNKWFLKQSVLIGYTFCQYYLETKIFASIQVRHDVQQNAKHVVKIVNFVNRSIGSEMIATNDELYQVAHPATSVTSWQHIIYAKGKIPSLPFKNCKE